MASPDRNTSVSRSWFSKITRYPPAVLPIEIRPVAVDLFEQGEQIGAACRQGRFGPQVRRQTRGLFLTKRLDQCLVAEQAITQRRLGIVRNAEDPTAPGAAAEWGIVLRHMGTPEWVRSLPDYHCLS